jgi:hypothetical protein
MARSQATTVEEYLQSLPEDRRAVVAAVRDVILKNLPAGYHESMGFGMINYAVPLERYPKTYNKQPLCYAALAAQKNYIALYLMGVYAPPERHEWFREEFRKAGKKLDMGKSCVRFRKLDDLPLDLIGRVIAGIPVDKWIAIYEASRKR